MKKLMSKSTIILSLFTLSFSLFFSILSYATKFCAGNRCVEAGTYPTSKGPYPFLAVSNDSGNTWNYKLTAENMLLEISTAEKLISYFHLANCNENSCMAYGFYRTANGWFPLVLVSNDGWETWNYKFTSGNLPWDAVKTDQFSTLEPAGCNGNLCLFSGVYTTLNGRYPLLSVSYDHGNTWNYKITSASMPFDAAPRGQFASLEAGKCTEDICMVSGYYTTYIGGTFPLLAISHNRGNTWNYKITSSNMPFDAVITDKQWSKLYPGGCHKNLCMASGFYKTFAGDYPLLAMSKDGGNTWSYKITSANMPSDAITIGQDAMLFHPNGCDENKCSATGSYLTYKGPRMFYATSTDGGNTWHYESGDYIKTSVDENPRV